jgi:hypothetical protein
MTKNTVAVAFDMIRIVKLLLIQNEKVALGCWNSTQCLARSCCSTTPSAACGREARNPKFEILSSCGNFAGREDSER